MPKARDYGHADSSTLVPGSLTVYRHFMANEGRLLPMNYNPSRAARGWPVSGAHRPYDCPPLRVDGLMSEPEVYEAECSKIGNYRARLAGDESHQAPEQSCTCGFYAHYAPDTDFYPSHFWGKAYARAVGQRKAEDTVILRAVCEVTGTTVMGRLGVRAQKMKILGLTVDWDKHVEPQSDMGEGSWVYSTDAAEDFYRMTLGDVERDDVGYITNQMSVLAFRYGVEYYADADAMVEAHPPADIEALGVDTNPPFSRQVKMSAYEILKAQQALYASLAQGSISVSTMAFNNSAPKPKPPSMNEMWAAALEAKRNREAPPGAGIDRRKRKL